MTDIGEINPVPRQPPSGVDDDVADGPALVIEVEIVDGADRAVGRDDLEFLHVLHAANHGRLHMRRGAFN
jgi:hypothetical protein